jgi:hypothetical protein
VCPWHDEGETFEIAVWFWFGFGLPDFALASARRGLLRKRFGCFSLAQASAFC